LKYPPYTSSLVRSRKRFGQRNTGINQTKNRRRYFFGMTAHIGTDAESGLVQSQVDTMANLLG
jgi:IS5 family transposase